MRWLAALFHPQQTNSSIRHYRRTVALAGILAVLFLLTNNGLIAAANRIFQATPEAGTIAYGATVTGQIAADGGQDWQFIGNVGDVVGIHLVRSAGNLVAGVSLKAADGQPLITVQAAQSGDLTLGDVPVPAPGVYTIHVFSVNHTAGSYTLALTNTGTPAASPTPITAATAGTMVYGQTVRGSLDAQTYNQIWTFTGKANDVIDVQMRVLSSTSDLTGFLTVRGPTGGLVATSGGVRPAPDALTGLLPRDAAIFAATLPNDGTYSILVSRVTNSSKPPFTSGDYLLSLTQDSAPSVTGTPNAVLTQIQQNDTVTGELTPARPISQFQLPNGTLAMRLSFSTPHRLAHLRVLAATGAIIFERSGLSPLDMSGAMAGASPLTVQIFAETYDDQPNSDFTLSVYPIKAAAPALRVETPVQGVIGNSTDSWFFIGEAGALVSLDMQTEPTVSGGLQTSVTTPNGTALLQRRSGASFDQPLLLPQTGAYQVTVTPIAGVSTTQPSNSTNATATPPPATFNYRLTLHAFGTNGTAFSRFVNGVPTGALTVAQSVTGSLDSTSQAAGLPLRQSWTVDALAGQSFDLTATVGHTVQPIGLLWVAPDGSILNGATGSGSTLIDHLDIRQSGRYIAIIFDPADLMAPTNGALTIPYALRLSEDSGGALTAGTPMKGLLTSTSSLAVWTIDVPAGSLIAAHVSAPGTATAGATASNPPSFAATLSLVDPGGQEISRSTTADLSAYRAMIGGTYRVLVSGQFATESVSYRLQADVQPIATTEAMPATPSVTESAGTSATRSPLLATSANTVITPPLPGQIASIANSLPVLLLDHVLRGEIPAAGQQIWRVATNAGNTLTLQAVPLGSDQAPDLALFDASGHLLAESLVSSSNESAGNRVLQLQYAASNALQLYLVAAAPPGVRYTLYGETLALNKTAPDVVDGRPIGYGQPLYGELLSAGQVDRYLVYGSGNDLINITAERITDDLVPSISVQTLNGLAFASDKNKDALPISIVGNARLPSSALYVVTVQQAATGVKTTGRYWLEIERAGGVPDDSLYGGILNVGHDSAPGTPVVGALSPGSTGSIWLVNGHAGQQISLDVTDAIASMPIAFQPMRIQLQDTQGMPIAAQDDPIGVGEAQLDHVTLPADGVYRVQVTSGAQAQGYYRLQGTIDSPSLANTDIIRYGQKVQGTFAPNHLTNAWAFSGTAGDTIAIALRSTYGQPFSPAFQVISASGVPLATAADVNNAGESEIDSLLLPFSGAYTIVAINPDTKLASTEVYSLSLSLLDTKAHSFGSVIGSGDVGNGELYPDDPVHTWLFSGLSGQTINAQAIATDSFLQADLSLQTINGTVLAHAAASDQPSAASIKSVVLPSDGVYVLMVTGVNHSTGSYRLGIAIDTPPVPIATITPGSAPQPGLIADDRVSSTFSFLGQSGTRIHAQVQRESSASLDVNLDLIDPAGKTLAHIDSYHGVTAALDGFVLPTSGTYQLVVSRFNGALGLSSGRFTISLTIDPIAAPNGALKEGKPTIGQLGDKQTADRWTFSGQAQQVVTIKAHTVGGDLDAVLALNAPDGSLIAMADDTTRLNPTIAGVALPTDGTYTITISRFGNQAQGSSGTYEVQFDTLFKVSTPPSGTQPIAFNQSVVGTLDATQPNAIWSFSGTAGQVVQADLTYPTDDVPMTLTLQGSDQTALSVALADSARHGVPNNGHSQILDYVLPITGIYLLRIDRPATTRAAFTPYTLGLSTLGNTALAPTATTSPQQSAIDGPALVLNQPIDGQFASSQPIARYPLHIPAGKAVRFRLIADTAGWQPAIVLLRPDGSAAGFSSSQQTPFGLTALLTLPMAANPLDYTLVTEAIGADPGGYRLSAQAGDALFDNDPTSRIIGTAFAVARPLVTGDGAVPVRDTLIGDLPAVWRFSGTARTILSFAMTFDTDAAQRANGTLPSLSVLDSHGAVLASAQWFGRELFINRLAIPDDNDYLLVLTAVPGASTGLSFTLLTQTYPVYLPLDHPAPHALVADVPQRGSLSTGKPTDYWTFNATVPTDDTVTVARTGGNVRLSVSIYDADGLIAAETADLNQDQLTFTLPQPILPGLHTLVVSRWQDAAGITFGNYQVQVGSGSAADATTPALTPTAAPAITALLASAASAPLIDDNAPDQPLVPDQTTTVSLGADSLVSRHDIASLNSASVALTVANATTPVNAYLLDSTGRVIASGQTGADGNLAIKSAAQAIPPYMVQVIPVALGQTGSVQLNVSEALAPNGGGLLGAVAKQGALSADRLAQSWRLDLKATQPFHLSVQRDTGDLPLIVTLYDAAGQVIPLNSAADSVQNNTVIYSGSADGDGRYTAVIAAPAGSQSALETDYTIAIKTP